MALSPHTNSPQSWKRAKHPRFGGFKKRKPHFLHREPRSRRMKRFAGIFVTLSIFAGIVGVGVVIAGIAYFSRDLPDPSQLIERQSVESSKIYDRTGTTVLYELHGDVKRTYIPLDQLPEYIGQAAISIEDKDFYTHHGVNFKSVFKAIFEKVTRGGQLRGASTITQQLVKNAILSSERTLSRKFKEWILSLQIERQYEKDQILELYLNEIPYGSVVYGIEAASQTFFAKPAKQLTVAEAAMLAGLPKAPTYYSPYGTHTDELFIRQQIILDKMAEQGYITSEEAELYKKEEITFSIKEESILAPHFVMYVRDLLAEQHGEKFLEEGGLTIITTLDLEKQKAAEEIIQERAPDNAEKYHATNAALVSLDANTGQVLAMVGSVDFFDAENDGQVNVALRPRQPGSSFKPIVYTASFVKGYTPETIVYDVATNFKDVCIGNPNYEPKNYTLQEYGAVTLRKALQGSLNISAVKTLYLTGIDRVIDLASEMGYTTIESQRGRLCLSLVLGGAEVKLLDHVSAFSVFAQEGLKREPSAILEVTDKQGKKMLEYKEESRRVLDQNVARLTNNVLSDNTARAYIFGTNSNLQIPGRPIAAKTGTTNDFRDGWTIGYTPSIVTGVWIGNNDNSEMSRGAAGGELASPIWNAFMRRALEGTPIEQFGEPTPNNAEKPVLRGEVEQEVKLSIDTQSGKIATEFTPPRNIEEKTFHPFHSILHYVDKDDPRGPAPDDPTREQQYVYWEAGIKAWAKKQQFELDYPPTGYDDIHTAENKPDLSIQSPGENETIEDRNFKVNIKASAPRGIAEAEYYLDDILLKRVFSSPFDLEYLLGDEVRNGFHTLRVFVYDDINNFDLQEINLNFKLEVQPVSYAWKNISGSIALQSKNFPYSFFGTIQGVNSVKRIEARYRKSGETRQNVISSTDEPQSASYTFSWASSPGTGQYEMYVVLTDLDGNKYTSDVIDVSIDGGSTDDDSGDGLFDKIFDRRSQSFLKHFPR